MKLEWLARFICVGTWLTWSSLALFLFFSGEEIYILPMLFTVFALNQLIAFFMGHNTLWLTLRVLVWCACLAIFSYLGTANSQAKLFFPILCISLVFSMLLAPFKKPQIYNVLLISTWLTCLALVFYFGFWPIGLISIGISLLFSAELSSKQKKEAQVGQKEHQLVQEVSQQEEQAVSPWPTFQIPGQQYQPLLPEYDRSFGSYIQDLPPDE